MMPPRTTGLKADSRQKNFDQVWHGATDIFEEGKFRWIGSMEVFYVKNGSPQNFNGFTQNEPNDSGNNEDCGTLWKSRSYNWNDGNCDSEMTSVCELRK